MEKMTVVNETTLMNIGAGVPFPAFYKALVKKSLDKLKETHEYIKNGYCDSWGRDEYKKLSDNGLKRYATNRTWEKYTTGIIDRETAVNHVINVVNKRVIKQYKEIAAELKRLDTLGPDPWAVEISTENKRNYTWGFISHSKVHAWNGRVSNCERDTAGGCGYDKVSSAAAGAMGKCDLIVLALIRAINKQFESGVSDLPYGLYWGPDSLAYINGGCGMGAIKEILEFCGYKAAVCDYWVSDRTNFSKFVKEH